MINSIKYRQAEEMKESCIEWLGKVPIMWETVALKYLIKYKKGKTPKLITSDTETLIPYVTSEYLRTGITENYVVSLKGLVEVEDGDLLLLWDGANAGEFFLGRKGALGSTFAKIERITDDNYNYIKYYAKAYEKYLKTMTIGMGIPHVSSGILKSLVLVKPNIKFEQRKIANFLEIKIAQFDSIISEKELLIQKLEEAKKSLITEVVSGKVKIVDGEMLPRQHDEMKDSGIAWLGMIPKDWKTIKLKRICSLIKDGTHNPPPRVDEGYPLLSVRNIINNKLSFLDDDSYISKKDFNILNRSFRVKEKDVLLAIVGATIGKVAIASIREPFTIQRSLAILRAKEDVCYFKFLFYFIMSDYFQRMLWVNIGFSAQPGIYLGNLANVKVLLPDISEQNSFIKFLDYSIEKIDQLIVKTETQIHKIGFAKQSLISEAVTGKIDLRDWEIIEGGELQ